MAQIGIGQNNLGFFQQPVVVGAQGAPGVGTNGFSVLNGTVNPSSSVGVDGDFYINTVTNFIFGPKTAGAWGSGTSLVGPAGAAADGIILDYQPSVTDTPNTGSWETLKSFKLPVIGSGTEGVFRVVLSTGSFANNECNYRFRILDGTLSASTAAFGAVGMQQHNIELSLVRNGTSLSYIQRGFISSSDFSGFDAPQVRFGAISTLDETLALTVEFQINIAVTATSPTQINAREFQVKLFTVAL